MQSFISYIMLHFVEQPEGILCRICKETCQRQSTLQYTVEMHLHNIKHQELVHRGYTIKNGNSDCNKTVLTQNIFHLHECKLLCESSNSASNSDAQKDILRTYFQQRFKKLNLLDEFTPETYKKYQISITNFCFYLFENSKDQFTPQDGIEYLKKTKRFTDIKGLRVLLKKTGQQITEEDEQQINILQKKLIITQNDCIREEEYDIHVQNLIKSLINLECNQLALMIIFLTYVPAKVNEIQQLKCNQVSVQNWKIAIKKQAKNGSQQYSFIVDQQFANLTVEVNGINNNSDKFLFGKLQDRRMATKALHKKCLLLMKQKCTKEFEQFLNSVSLNSIKYLVSNDIKIYDITFQKYSLAFQQQPSSITKRDQ